jgi:CRP/FNR family transcriptional regulator, cyclic AMP receptor protein
MSDAGGVPLLALDPDLGAGLSTEEFDRAYHEISLPVVDLPVGPWSLDTLRPGRPDGAAPRADDDLLGFLVIRGTLTIDTRVLGRPCSRPIGRGELVLLDHMPPESLPVTVGWSALAKAQVGILDGPFLELAQRWPVLVRAVLQRAAAQAHYATVLHAITQLTHVEDRLLCLFWSLADRYGIVRPSGIWVALPATHEALARMVGARRSTVTLGLRALAESGRVHAENNGWLLDHEALAISVEPASEVGAGRQPGRSAAPAT